MNDLRQCSKDFLTEFYSLYKSLPCLWQVKCPDYMDRDKKNEAYEILVKKWQEVDPSASRDMITKKINSFRSTWRKEYLKVKKSRKTATNPESIHQPSLWYYELLSFLGDQETGRRANASSNEDNDDQEGGTDSERNCEMKFQPPSPSPSASDRITMISPSPSCSVDHVVRTKRRTTRGGEEKDIVSLELQEKRIRKSDSEDRFDVFGKNVAHTLRLVDPKQVIFAQKLINDVLFEAQLGTLSPDQRIVSRSNPASSFVPLQTRPDDFT